LDDLGKKMGEDKMELRITSQEVSPVKRAKTPSVVSLKKKLKEKDRKLKEVKQETRVFLNELDMAYKELRKTQEELILKEKLSVAGGFATGIAHEIKSSLNVIAMSVQHLHTKFSPGDDRREFTGAVLEKVEKLNSLATELIQFARPHEPDIKKNDIHDVVDRVLNLVKFKCVVQKIKIQKRYSPRIPKVSIDKELMEQVILNIVDNALWAMPKGGDLIITTRNSANNGSVEVKISDTGLGIAPSDCSRIFDPFFTKKADGTGLGLSIVHRIIEEHKGIINVESQLNKGTTFLIRLPVSLRNRKKRDYHG
jgi:signal transduction histidine kinase